MHDVLLLKTKDSTSTCLGFLLLSSGFYLLKEMQCDKRKVVYSHCNRCVMSLCYLEQRLSDLAVLWVVKVQHLWSQAIVIRSHLVQVHHVRVGIEHSPPALSVHLWELDGQHLPVPLIESLRQPQRQLHLCPLGQRRHEGERESKSWSDHQILSHKHSPRGCLENHSTSPGIRAGEKRTLYEWVVSLEREEYRQWTENSPPLPLLAG